MGLRVSTMYFVWCSINKVHYINGVISERSECVFWCMPSSFVFKYLKVLSEFTCCWTHKRCTRVTLETRFTYKIYTDNRFTSLTLLNCYISLDRFEMSNGFLLISVDKKKKNNKFTARNVIILFSWVGGDVYFFNVNFRFYSIMQVIKTCCYFSNYF